MLAEDVISAYNQRVTTTLGELHTLSPSQRDSVIAHGSRAERLLQDPDLVMFIHQFRFEVADGIAAITTHDTDSNSRRVALANHLTGIDQFVASLQRAVYRKNRLTVSTGEGPRDAPRDPTKEVYR